MAGLKTYIAESYDELIHKVTWPSWASLQSSSVLVFVASLIMSLIIFAMDFTVGVNDADMWWEGGLGHLYRDILAS